MLESMAIQEPPNVCVSRLGYRTDEGQQMAYFIPGVHNVLGVCSARNITERTPDKRTAEEKKQNGVTGGRQCLPPVIKVGYNRPCIWIMFGGNAMLALEWIPFVRSYYERHAKFHTHTSSECCSFLLIDYPGYGRNDGTANPSSIVDGIESAMDELAFHLGGRSRNHLAHDFSFGTLFIRYVHHLTMTLFVFSF